MAEVNGEKSPEKGDQGGVKSSDTMLKVATLVVAVALIAVVALLWLNYRRDLRGLTNIALDNSENGQVLGASTQNPDYLANLAISLKNAGYILYGSSSDTNTKRQKDIFGQGFSDIDYVECDQGVVNSNSQECVAKGIDIYPTWVQTDKKFPGYKSLNELEKLLASNQQ